MEIIDAINQAHVVLHELNREENSTQSQTTKSSDEVIQNSNTGSIEDLNVDELILVDDAQKKKFYELLLRFLILIMRIN